MAQYALQLAGAARSVRLLRAGRQYLDLAVPHPRAEHRELAVARIGALAGQRVELPQVVHAGQRVTVKASLAELETQMGAAVLEGPDLACHVEQDDLLLAQLDPVEVAAYYAVAEALTNMAKYAGASAAEVEATANEGVLQVRVRDDGRGGADFGHGSGLAGLKDRIEALGGRIWLHSPPGAGTTVQIALPLGGPSRPAWES
jgi:signal transduction histidine kinase